MRTIRFAAIVVAALLCVGAAKPDSREAGFLESAQLERDAKVQYLDDQGRTLSFDAFFAQVMKGRQFGYTHDGRVEAVFRISPLQAAPERARHERVPALKAGDGFPAFALKTTGGLPVSNAAMRGRLTLVNFFFADCVPCIAEIPALNSYARQHPEVKLLAVTFDDAAIAKKFAAQRKLQWPILAEGQALLDAAGVTVFPSFVLVGPDGKVRATAASAVIAGKRPLDVATLSLWVAKNRKATGT